MKKTTLLAAMLATGIMSAQADFTLVEDFEGYADGSNLADASAWAMTDTTGTGTPATIETDGSSNVARLAGVDGTGEGNTNYSIDLGANAFSGVGTIYFETTQNVGATDHAMSFFVADTTSGIFDYAGAIIFTDNLGDLRARGLANPAGLAGSGWANAITYKFWMVTDTDNNTFDAYVQGGVYTDQTLIVTDAAFRVNMNEITRLTINANKNMDAGSTFDVDNIYVDTTGENLSAIPEPATLGIVAAVGGAMLFIRRKIMM